MNIDKNEIQAIEGAGGKGGGGSRAVEAPNTLSSRAIVKIIDVLSEGEIVGIAGGGQGIYFNDTPLQNSDDSYNFARAQWDYRVGLPDQAHMPGFPAVESEVSIGTVVTTTTPVVRTMSSAAIDAARITISLPQGLYEQDTSNGNMNGTLVSFAIDRKLSSSGTWAEVGTYNIDGKTTSVTEKQYRVERPSGAGAWDVRVRRLTADATVSTLRNQISFARVTEIQDVKLPYNDTAYVGLAVDAETVANRIPKRGYLVKGIIVKVPSNYNPTTRAYTGIWNGTFVNAWTDNPAWCLYDLLTNVRYGMGEFISEDQIDKFSFYDAAVYCDELVPDGNGGQEPRFTFNARLGSREEALRLLNAIAGSMRAKLLYQGGLIRVMQDRPADVAKLISKANVIDGVFDYRSSSLQERHTAYNVSFNDRTDRHLQRLITIDASTTTGAFQTALTAAEAKYGYNPTDIAAFGATTEGQARRQGMWALDTELNQTEIVQFKMSLNGFDLMPYDIVSVWDEDYVNARGAGRIVSVSGTTVVLDRPITLVAGSTIDVLLADGTTIERRTIVESAGSLSTIHVASGFSQTVLAGADWQAHLAAAPRQFRVMEIRQEEPNIITVEGLLHDPNKYARVETGVTIPAPVFSVAQRTITSAPTSLDFREIQINNEAEGLNGLRRSLLVSWVAPAQGVAKSYLVKYRLGTGEWLTAETSGQSYEINPAFGGTYQVSVAAVSVLGLPGPTVTGSYAITTTGGGASALNPPTNLQVIGGGTSFTGLDLNIQWTNPTSNGEVTTATLRDFEVRFIETSGSTTVRTLYVPAVPAGQNQTSAYTFSMNVADGGPRRTVQVQVRCRDGANNLSSPVTVTFSNPAPAALSNLSVVAGINNLKLTYDRPTDLDFKGVLVWRSTTSGFTPSAANLVYDTTSSYIADNALDFGTTYYYRLAAYDDFSRPTDGAGLNLSVQQSGAPLASEGIPEVSSLPSPTGYTGPGIIYNTADGKLYSYVGGAWEATIPEVSGVADGTITITKFASGLRPLEIVTSLPSTGNVQGRMVLLTGDNKIYRYTGSAWSAAVPSTDITGTLTNSQIADLAAAKITGTLTASQIADATLTTAKFASSIKPIEVVSTLPTTGNVQGRTVFLTTDNKLYRHNGTSFVSTLAATDITGTLADAQIAAVAASKLTGTIVSSQIADAAITTAKFASTIKPIEIVSTLPTTGNVQGRMVFLTTDNKLYRHNGTAYTVAVDGADIVASSITAGKIAAGAISATEIASNAITSDKINAGAITTAKLAAGAVTANEIAAATITGAKIAAGTIAAANIAADTITSAQIAANAITSTELAASSVIAGKIAAGAISATEIAADAITSNKILVTGKGAELNADPNTMDASAWTPSPVIVAVPDLDGGATAIQRAASAGWYLTEEVIALDQSLNYRIEMTVRQLTSTGATAYLGIVWYDAGGTQLSSNVAQPTGAGSPAGWPGNGTYSYFGLVSGVVPTAWTTYGINFGPDETAKIPTNAKFCRLALGLNHNSTAAATVQATRVRLLRKTDGNLIVDGSITAKHVAANSITTSKLFVTGQGDALNDDPAFSDTTAWTLTGTGTTFGSGASSAGAIGSTYITNSTSASDAKVWSRRMPINPTKTYSLTANLFAATGNNRNMYLFAQFYNSAGVFLATSPNWGGSLSGYVYGGQPTPNAWTVVGGLFGAGEASRPIPASAAFVEVGIWFQYSGGGTSAVQQLCQNLRIVEAVDNALLVNGTITGTKVAANTITGSNIAANTITASNIAANTITATQIAANTITSSQISADTITAGNIAAGAIGASEVAANAITTKALLVTGNNFIANSDFATGDYSNWRVWAGAGNQAILPSSDASVPVSAPANYVCKFYYTTVGVSVATFAAVSAYSDAGASQDGFDVLPGNVYDVRLYAAKSADYAAAATNVLAYFWKSDGTFTTALTAITLQPSLTTAWAEYKGSFTAPTGAVKCWMYVVATTITAGSFFWTRLRVKERANADLIVDGSIVASKIATGTITSNEIAANTITGGKIAAATIAGSNIAAGTITASNIATDTITADKIAAGAITAAEIAAGTITATQLAAGAVTAAKMATGTITAASGIIADAAITWAKVQNLTINTDGAISSGQTAFDTGTGFWLGRAAGTPKFSIGSSTKAIAWDGATLTVRGDLIATGNLVNDAVSTPYYVTGAAISSSVTVVSNGPLVSSETTILTLSTSATGRGGVLILFDTSTANKYAPAASIGTSGTNGANYYVNVKLIRRVGGVDTVLAQAPVDLFRTTTGSVSTALPLGTFYDVPGPGVTASYVLRFEAQQYNSGVANHTASFTATAFTAVLQELKK